ncbi:MAG: PstS family phosphate ABC transporter substrate-binding protein [Sumerlaeia bacterium]
MRNVFYSAVTLLAALGVAGCGSGGSDSGASSNGTAADGEQLSGDIRIDGSSTVFPITAAVAEEFQAVHPRVRVAVSYSGTGGGFKKFDLGETDINNASRPIKQSEIDTATENEVEFIELPVAYDGLTVIVSPSNEFVDYLTVDELRKIWQPSSIVDTWDDVRPEWPEEEIKLFGPGTDSGTFDYFTEAIMGESGASRSDYTATEDDNLIVTGVARDPYALGYLGYAYYIENEGSLRPVPIKDGDKEPVAPTQESIDQGTYTPLSRPLFVYVRADAAKRPEVDAFMDFYLDEGRDLVSEIGYVALPDAVFEMVQERFDDRVTGSLFGGAGAEVGVSVKDVLARERASQSSE